MPWSSLVKFLFDFIGGTRLFLILAVFLAAGSFISGWKVCQWMDANEEKDRLLSHIQRADELRSRLEEKERALLEQASARAAQVREVIRYVPKYVDTGKCTLSPDGVRAVNSVLSGGDP